MKYSYKNINIIKERLEKCDFITRYRISEKDYIRKRKVSPQDIILYELNKKGLSSKIINFNNINDIKNISSPGLFKQREKLNPDAFIYLMQESLKEFYVGYKKSKNIQRLCVNWYR